MGSGRRRGTRLSTPRPRAHSFISPPLCHVAERVSFVMRAARDKSGNVLANLMPIETENWIHFREPMECRDAELPIPASR